MQKFYLKNLDCADCAVKLEERLKSLDFVQKVSINFATSTMKITTTNIDKVKNEIKKIEPEIEILKEEEFNFKKEIIILGLLILSFILAFIFNKLFISKLIFIVVYLCSGFSVFKNAFLNIKSKKLFDENVLMTIATIGAIIIGKFEEATTVMILYKIGLFLEKISLTNSRKSIKKLLELKIESANVITEEGLKVLKPEEVKINDIIIVKAGEKIPLDGIIIEGSSYLDTSAISGESLPKFFKEGDEVLAGMINKNGLIKIRVTKTYKNSSINKIIELVEYAVSKKSKVELFFTKFASIYTPIVILVSIFAMIILPFVSGISFSEAIYRGLIILVISCPCALVISIPLSYFAGIGVSSRHGILLKGSDCIDKLTKIERIYFDKTGTITKGEFNLKEVKAAKGFDEGEILELAAKIEYNSNHPIANSIKEKYGRTILDSPAEYEEFAGMGIRAKINDKTIILGNDRILHYFDIKHDRCNYNETTIHMAINNTYAGNITIGDKIKDEALEVISELKKLGIKELSIISGDNRESTRLVAEKLGIDFSGELLPEEKANIVGSKPFTAFVGDGINDSPSLAAANPGIAMGKKGSDIAIEYSDIVIVDDNLKKIPEAIKIAKKTKNIIIQNVVFALGIKLFFIVLGFYGVANMWEAVFSDVGVTLITLFNSLRILKAKY